MINDSNISREERIKEFFEKKPAIDKIDYDSLIGEEMFEPDFPEGEVLLTITESMSEEMYGKYTGNIKIEFTLEDPEGNKLKQMYILKNGKNINLAKFICQALGEYPEDELIMTELEGKKILATISHYYTDLGVGYANIAFCRPVSTKEEKYNGIEKS